MHASQRLYNKTILSTASNSQLYAHTHALNMVMTIAPFGLESGPALAATTGIAGQHVAPWQAAFLTPIHLSWQGVATHVDATETDNLIPLQDATETDKEYKLRIDLPGFSPEGVDIELQGEKLSITATKEEGQAADAGKAKPRKGTPSFSRSFALPDNLREDDISASLDKGVLTVTLPKAAPADKPQPKTVSVQARPVKAAAAADEAAAPSEADQETADTAQGQCTYRPWGRCRK